MSFYDDQMDMEDYLKKGKCKQALKIWEDVILPKINEMEAVTEAASKEVSICNANVMSNNALFNYLIDNDIVSRETLIECKIKANLPHWYSGWVNGGKETEESS